MNGLGGGDLERLQMIENSCRDIYYQMQTHGDSYAAFAANAPYRAAVFSALRTVSEMACGLSRRTYDALRAQGFHSGYLQSIRLWMPQAETGGESYWRTAWQIVSQDCVPLLMACARLSKH